MNEDFIKKIRSEIADILKQVEDFAVNTEKTINARENELTEQMKKYETLKERENDILRQKEEILKSKKEVTKQVKANRDKQIALEKKEEELQDKLQRVKSILN